MEHDDGKHSGFRHTCVTLDKGLHLSELQFFYLHLWMTRDSETVSSVPGMKSELQEQEYIGGEGVSRPGRAASCVPGVLSVLSFICAHQLRDI